MFSVLASVWGDLSSQDIIRLRFLSMFVVLLVGLSGGYLASNRFGLSEQLARKIMTVVLLALNWPIGLFIIWQMKLTAELFWLPVIAVVLLLIVTFLCRFLFTFHKLEEKSRMTLILAGGLSNNEVQYLRNQGFDAVITEPENMDAILRCIQQSCDIAH